MIIYQVKIEIDLQVATQWFHWMKTKHVPDVLDTGLIQTAQIWQSRDQSNLYYFNYYFGSISDYEEYHSQYGPKLKADTQDLYGGKFVASRQLLNMV